MPRAEAQLRLIPGQVTTIHPPYEEELSYPITKSSIPVSAPLPLLFFLGDLQPLVRLPYGVNEDHWLATHTIDFFKFISLIPAITSITNICTPDTCGVTNCGESSEYRLRADAKGAIRVSAKDYFDRILSDIEKKINDNALFPVKGLSYPADFRKHVEDIFRYLFRVFSHMYTSHYGALQHLNLDRSFNTVFNHFMHFVAEFNLISAVEFHPVKELMRAACPSTIKLIIEKQAKDVFTTLKDKPKQLQLFHELVAYYSTPNHEVMPSPPQALSAQNFFHRHMLAFRDLIKTSISTFYTESTGKWSLFVSRHNRYRPRKSTITDFEILSRIGEGGVGGVQICREKNDPNPHNIYALKTIKKAFALDRGIMHRVLEERDVMVKVGRNNPWLVAYKRIFQDRENAYILMEFCPGGDLMTWLSKKDVFTEREARFYTAELVLAVEALHHMGVAHRDLKPDNVLLDSSGHIKIADFGLAMHNRNAEQNSSLSRVAGEVTVTQPAFSHARFFSLVGSPGYVAPEVLSSEVRENGGYDDSIDWWGVGSILYEMVFGCAPQFNSGSVNLTGDSAAVSSACLFGSGSLVLYNSVVSSDCYDLIKRLLCVPSQRIDLRAIKEHPFFNGIDWNNLRQSESPFAHEIELRGPDDIQFCVSEETIPGGHSLNRSSRYSSMFEIPCFSAAPSTVFFDDVAAPSSEGLKSP